MNRKMGTPVLCKESILEDVKTEGVWNYPTVWKDITTGKWVAIYGGCAPFSYDERAGFCIKTVELYRATSEDGIHWMNQVYQELMAVQCFMMKKKETNIRG